MSDGITRAELEEAVRNLGLQIDRAVRDAVREQRPAPNPPARRADSEAWRQVDDLRAELRARDRAELDEMRREIGLLRERRQDPLEQIEQARGLIAALGPEPPSEVMTGLSYLSNVAEAYIERKEEADESRQETARYDAPTGEEQHAESEGSHHFEVDPSHGPATASDLGLVVLEESG